MLELFDFFLFPRAPSGRVDDFDPGNISYIGRGFVLARDPDNVTIRTAPRYTDIQKTLDDFFVAPDNGEVTVKGRARGETIVSSQYDDIVDGKGGNDVFCVNGASLEYNVSRQEDGSILVEHARAEDDGPDDGTDILTNIETLKFADGREIDLTAETVHGFTRIVVGTDVVVGGPVFDVTLTREGDNTYDLDVFVDATTLQPVNIPHLPPATDGTFTFLAGESASTQQFLFGPLEIVDNELSVAASNAELEPFVEFDYDSFLVVREDVII